MVNFAHDHLEIQPLPANAVSVWWVLNNSSCPFVYVDRAGRLKARPSPRRFHREPQAHRLGHGNQRGEARIPTHRQRAIQTLALNASGLATLAIPPLASAMRRSAIRSTLGSSASSKAALRYSAAKSGLSRSSRTVASSCDMLALRFHGHRVLSR